MLIIKCWILNAIMRDVIFFHFSVLAVVLYANYCTILYCAYTI